MKRLLIAYDKCVGCDTCSISCSLGKTGLANSLYARIHIVRDEGSGVILPAVCRHCHTARCIPVCPVSAVSRHPETRLISIDAALCNGCEKCVEACPFGGPTGVPFVVRQGEKISTVKVLCDLCGGNPVCVEACPAGAISFAEPDPSDHAVRRKALEEVSRLVSAQKKGR